MKMKEKLYMISNCVMPITVLSFLHANGLISKEDSNCVTAGLLVPTSSIVPKSLLVSLYRVK